MLQKENGVGYGVVDGTPAPLADDMGGITMSPPWELGMVETSYEIDGVSLTIGMAMQ